MNVLETLEKEINLALENVFDQKFEHLELAPTRKEFQGELTLLVFPLLKKIAAKPEEIGQRIGEFLLKGDYVSDFNVVKGFLNLSLKDDFLCKGLFGNVQNKDFGKSAPNQKVAMVEYSSPNTNKPLHLGHVRNNLLGYSVSKILDAAGYKVIKAQVINDRGIHICKSMVAWQKFAQGETPETQNRKGDHFVGDYYVAFDQAYKKEIDQLVEQKVDLETAKQTAPILLDAKEMLVKWEAQDPEVIALWETMNSWVYKGFEKTYQKLGVDFDLYQYESKTYLLGKDIVQNGLEKGVFYSKPDGSVWCDLTEFGLDEKLVLRNDGTSVYITQDLGTAVERFEKYKLNSLVYTVGNEQDYHFQVLFLILKKLGYDFWDQMEHLSYGMVDLPTGKMKSREGTVVDADDLMEQMYQTAKEISKELGKIQDFSEEQKEEVFWKVGLGALKYYILKVDPKKRILFDPQQSVDFSGNTGPFILYTYARINSLFSALESDDFSQMDVSVEISDTEKQLLVQLFLYPEIIQKAAQAKSPAQIANYLYDLVKSYNGFYQNYPILKLEDQNLKKFRLMLSKMSAQVIESALDLFGIQTTERM